MSTDAKETKDTTTMDQIKAMAYEALAELAGRLKLPIKSGMKRRELLELVLAARSGGGAGEYVPAKTLCEYCRDRVDVVHTSYSEDGTVRIRRVRCRSKHHHTYQLTEPVMKTAPAKVLPVKPALASEAGTNMAGA